MNDLSQTISNFKPQKPDPKKMKEMIEQRIKVIKPYLNRFSLPMIGEIAAAFPSHLTKLIDLDRDLFLGNIGVRKQAIYRVKYGQVYADKDFKHQIFGLSRQGELFYGEIHGTSKKDFSHQIYRVFINRISLLQLNDHCGLEEIWFLLGSYIKLWHGRSKETEEALRGEAEKVEFEEALYSASSSDVSSSPSELFTVKQREALLAAYVEKTGRAGEYLVCEHGFLWDSSGINDADFARTCERLGIQIPTQAAHVYCSSD